MFLNLEVAEERQMVIRCGGVKTNDTWLQMAKAFSMKDSESKKLRLRLAQVAQRCSYYLHLNRKNKEWHHPLLLPGWEF